MCYCGTDTPLLTGGAMLDSRTDTPVSVGAMLEARMCYSGTDTPVSAGAMLEARMCYCGG